MRISIGTVLSGLMQEKNLSAISMSEKLGKTRQNVYNDLKRTTMRDENIEEYAQAMNISKDEIYARWKDNETTSENITGIDLLADQIAKIEQMFAQQLAIKDEQIKGLQRTVDVLLGKSECVTEKTGKVIELVAYEVGQIA